MSKMKTLKESIICIWLFFYEVALLRIKMRSASKNFSSYMLPVISQTGSISMNYINWRTKDEFHYYFLYSLTRSLKRTLWNQLTRPQQSYAELLWISHGLNRPEAILISFLWFKHVFLLPGSSILWRWAPVHWAWSQHTVGHLSPC